MLKKGIVAILSLGLLSSLGMPLHRPCCSMAELTSSAARTFDCCSLPDCCRNERRGAAPGVLSPKSAAMSLPAIKALSSAALVSPRASSGMAFRTFAVPSWHGPPRIMTDLPILLSALRV